MRSTLLKWALGAVCAAGVLACESGENHILEGRKAVQSQNYDKALKHFDDALAAEPDNYHALWGKADVYRRDNNLAKQAEVLEAISKNAGHMERYAGVVKPALETNYRKQAQALADTDAKKEEYLRKAIDLDKKSEANNSLATLLSKRGDAAFREGKFKDAENDFEAAIKLRISRKVRNTLKGKAQIASFKAFIAEFQPRFDAVRKELEEAKIYDDKTKTFFIEATAEIEGDPKEEGYEKNAEIAGLAAVTVALNDLTWKVAGKTRPENALVTYSASVVSIVEKGFSRPATRKEPALYKFRISVPADALFEQVQRVDKGEFKTGDAANAAPASDADVAPASDGADGDEPEDDAPASDAPASDAPASDAPASDAPAAPESK